MNASRSKWTKVLLLITAAIIVFNAELIAMGKYHYVRNVGQVENSFLLHNCETEKSQFSGQRICYSKEQLLAVRSTVSNNTIPPFVHSACKQIERLNTRKRGRKAGSRSKTADRSRGANLNNLINVKITDCASAKDLPLYTKLIAYNTRSAMAKPMDINEYITDNKADILSMCETWIKPGDDAKINEMCPKNFVFHGEARGARGGGVGLVINDIIPVKQDNQLGRYNTFEYHSVILHLQAKRVKLVTIYRPPCTPNTSMTDFLLEFEELLSEVTMFPDSILLVGDFNIHCNKPDLHDVRQFNDILDSFDLHQHVQEATHKFGNTLDLVISPSEDDIIDTVSVLPRLDWVSDHHPICCILRAAKPNSDSKVIRKRCLKNLDMKIFADTLVEELNISTNPSDQLSAEKLENTFKSCSHKVLDTLAPEVEKKLKPHKPHPWYNDNIHLMRQKRRRLERKWQKSRKLEDWQTYETHYQQVVQSIKQAKQAYYQDRLSSSPNDAFSVINNLLQHRGTFLPSCTSDSDLADKFVDFFTEKISNIRASLDDCLVAESSDSVTSACPHKLNSFVPVTADDLYKVIMKSKTKTCRIDPVPTHLLKDPTVLNAVLPYLTKMVNASLESGVVPKALKTALVIPHLKKQGLDPEIFKNYRPVSNLQFLGKVIEKCVSSQICKHISTYKLGDQLQSAYKGSHSTETALLKVKRDIDHEIDSGRAVLLVMLDLSAAFDTIDHTILADREFIGVEGSALEWLKSYMEGRIQKVVINNSVSKDVHLSVGVPQGSVLGPLLFLIYILPLSRIIRDFGVSHHGYADDTQLYIAFDPKSSDGLSHAIGVLERCITKIKNWMITNKLKLNDDKTEFQVFASPYYYAKVMLLNPTIKIGDSVIKSSKKIRNLGVIMDSNLTMSPQISAVSKSMYFHMRRIRHIRHYLDDATCTKAVMTIVISRLDFSNALLAGISEAGLHKLQVAQNTAARLITRTPMTEHITPVLYRLHWLPVYKRVTHKSLSVLYRCLNDPEMPAYLSELFVKYKPGRNLRSATSGVPMVIKRTKTKYGDRKFETWASGVWNDLPEYIQEAPSLLSFKRQLKTHLFQQHYSRLF